MGIRLYIYIVFIFSFFSTVESFSQSRNNLFLNTKNKIYQIDKPQTVSNELNVAFLLPFCLESNDILSVKNLDSLIAINESVSDYDFDKKTKISIDFFLGFLRSLNQFPDLDISISVFDIKDGSNSQNILKSIIDNRYLNNMDLIIGPLFTDNVLFLLDRFNKKIPIISPFSKKKEIIQKNENVFQLETDLLFQLSVFSQYIFDTHLHDNIIMVRRDTLLDYKRIKVEGESDYTDIIDTILPNDIMYSKLFNNHIDTSLLKIEEVVVQSTVIDSIHHKLDTLGMNNIIIIPSDDNVFVTDLLSKLHACRDTSMIVYTLPIVSDFDHVSIYDLMDMKVTFPHNSIFNNESMKHFIIDFHNTYQYFPTLRYAKVGYETGIYFLDFLLRHGSIIPHINAHSPKTILGTQYYFQKENNSGYRNNAFLILRYNNFGYHSID